MKGGWDHLSSKAAAASDGKVEVGCRVEGCRSDCTMGLDDRVTRGPEARASTSLACDRKVKRATS